MSTATVTTTVSRLQAITIAEADGIQAYGSLEKFTLEVALQDDGWHVDYWLRKPRHAGGGPHYIIDAATGEIAFKKYTQ